VLYHGAMAEQLSMVVLVLALVTGLVTSIVATTRMQAQQPEFFRYFLTNILLFNLLILSGLVFKYMEYQLRFDEFAAYQFFLPVLLAIMALLKLSWLYAFMLMNKALPADIFPKRSAKMLARSAAAFFITYVGVVVTAWFMRVDGVLNAAIYTLEVLIIGGALLATIQLLVTANKLPGSDRRKSILLFGGYHLALLGIIFTVLVMGWLQPGPQKLAHSLANGGFLILFNLFPLIWMKWFQPTRPASMLERFELFGITRREREIIGLIQAGKTNQEIADKLFISVATVKDHNHNIFVKSGVRNRLELANLFK